MQFIHCTQKLLKELGVKKADFPEKDPGKGILGPWYANLFRIERRKNVLFTNEATLYSFLVAGVKKADLIDLAALFTRHLKANLVAEGFGAEESTRAIEEYDVLIVAPTRSRSVLGSMNDLVGEAEFLVYRYGGLEQCDIIKVNKQVNRMPLKSNGYKYGIEKLKEQLSRV